MIRIKKKKEVEEINASSMADIAFLLFIFFLITTTVVANVGLEYILPPKKDTTEPPVDFPKRNMFSVLLNNQDKLLARDQLVSLTDLTNRAIEFIENPSNDENLSESPSKAIISLKADRAASFGQYCKLLDAVESAYFTLRAKHLGLTVEEYLKLDKKKAEDFVMLKHAKAKYPLNITEVEPVEY